MSEVPELTEAESRKAVTMLRSVMAAAEKEAGDLSIMLAESSPIGRMAMKHYSRANLMGLHIYHRLPWGWYADVLLKDVPAGVPDAIGVPIRSPLASEEEAHKAGVSLVAFVIAVERWRAEGALGDTLDDELRFDFYGIYLGLIPEAIQIAALIADRMGYERSTDDCYKRLDEMKTTLFGTGGIAPKAFDALPETDRLRLLVVIAYSISKGILRCPAGVPDLKDWKG